MRLKTIQVGRACLTLLKNRKALKLIDVIDVTGIPRSSVSKAMVTLGKAHVIERDGKDYRKGDSADDYGAWWKEHNL
jgi:DNA-binding IclR family transcriptional regulator